MAVKNFVQAIPDTFFNAAALNAQLQAINPNGTNEACFLIRIINDSNTAVNISYDGITVHDYVRAGESLQLPFQSNSQPRNETALLRKGTVVYVRGTAGPGVGFITLCGYYQPNNP